MTLTRAATLASRLSSQVPAAIRSRGESYFRSGAVGEVAGDDLKIKAEVLGSLSYQVTLEYDPEEGLLGASCSCRYFEDRFEVCKHIWAVILHADRFGLLNRLRSSDDPDPAVIVPEPGDLDGDLEPIPDEPVWQAPPLSRRKKRKPRSKAAPPRQTPDPYRASGARQAPSMSWRTALGEVQRRGRQVPEIDPAGHDRHELLYILEPSSAPGAMGGSVSHRQRKTNGR